MQSRAVEYRNHLIAVHDRGCSYYEAAESPEWLARFWAPDCRFRLLFETLDLANVIDFACGHGRHTAQFLARADHVTLVDANASNIQVCRKRFAGSPKIRCLVNEATSVPCPSSMYSAVFSYDALVHFEASDMVALISEFARVLKPGGKALLHYSNYQDKPTGTFTDSYHWRNFFSEAMMLHFASRVDLHALESMTFKWSDDSISDALTLFEKRAPQKS